MAEHMTPVVAKVLPQEKAAFAAATQRVGTTPSNAIRMGEALKRDGVQYSLHLYPSGGHGCALAFSKEAHDWSRAMTEFFRDR